VNPLCRADRIVAFLRKVNREADRICWCEATEPAAVPIELPWGDTVYLRMQGLAADHRETLVEALQQLLRYEHEAVDMTHELTTGYEEMTLLYRLSQAFSETLDLTVIQKTALREIADSLDVKKVCLFLLNSTRDGLELIGGIGVAPGDLGHIYFPQGQGPAWQVVSTGQSLIANDVSGLPEYVPASASETTLLLVPLSTKRGLEGVLTVSGKCPTSEFTSKDEKLLAAIAHQMGAVWENARLYRETRELFLNTVEALAAAIDAKDPYTHGHSRRVTDFSMAIAHELPISEQELELIRISALLHDIGKIGVDEAILRKPDRLTNEEFGEIKKHPGIGADIMNRVKTLSRFIPGMIDHHEKFNGSGYPLGRKGDEISLAGRIIAVADTLDAITSDRPYHPGHKGKPDEVALGEIQKCSGTHFDPDIVAAFFRAYQNGVIQTQVSQVSGPENLSSAAPVALPQKTT
jgi:putative nucleotidyltransferase with HDIG domain